MEMAKAMAIGRRGHLLMPILVSSEKLEAGLWFVEDGMDAGSSRLG
jgi:hypothetical protein